jgi:hypothetical protein
MTTQKTFYTWLEEFNKRPSPMRLGQAFMNRFEERVIDPDLFNEKDPKRAVQKILFRYISG